MYEETDDTLLALLRDIRDGASGIDLLAKYDAWTIQRATFLLLVDGATQTHGAMRVIKKLEKLSD